ncbi:hypothetical protein NPIL_252921 [Nephila pilipes]|uniref:Uncharacterized protein n=1 Tax=Nephila pilipes TaxID=299642 RepID=A0A8X6QVI0_NEPPI|nr:hypothetical protein NPIL_252921 [Nephila pilipes]
MDSPDHHLIPSDTMQMKSVKTNKLRNILREHVFIRWRKTKRFGMGHLYFHPITKRSETSERWSGYPWQPSEKDQILSVIKKCKYSVASLNSCHGDSKRFQSATGFSFVSLVLF